MVSLGELFFLALAFAVGGLTAALGAPAWLVVTVPCVMCAVALAIELVGGRPR